MNQHLNGIAGIPQAHSRNLWSWISLAIELVGQWNLWIRVSYLPNYKAAISDKITCWEGEQFPLNHFFLTGIGYALMQWSSFRMSSSRVDHVQAWHGRCWTFDNNSSVSLDPYFPITIKQAEEMHRHQHKMHQLALVLGLTQETIHLIATFNVNSSFWTSLLLKRTSRVFCTHPSKCMGECI